VATQRAPGTLEVAFAMVSIGLVIADLVLALRERFGR
jgi:hypothetical protein